MNRRTHSKDRIAVLLVAGCLVACGSTADPAPDAAPAGKPPARGGEGAAVSTAPSPALPAVAPPRPARIAERGSASIEECIERNIHDKEYDSMNPRDARRKLRRLQVKADCEQQLAAR